MPIEDEADQQELNKMDPHDVFGYISLGSTLLNAGYSFLHDYYTFDVLISVSVILGIMSLVNKGGVIAKLSLSLLLLHLAVVYALRLI